MKIIDNNLDGYFWKVMNPKRCVLNRYCDVYNISGYVVEIIDRNFDKELLFIADIPDGTMFHDGVYLIQFVLKKDAFG